METNKNPNTINQLIKARKQLHKYPEVSENEIETTKFIFNFLTEHASNAEITKLDCNGVIACFDSKTDGSNTLIRVDIDALPIQEINEFEYKSEFPGVSHKCGHDGHTVIGLGLAIELNTTPPKFGKVFIVFQPAEEVGTGAVNVLKHPLIQNTKFDFAYALHNLPGKETGKIYWKEGVFTSNVFSWIFRFNGKTAHAAEPEHGINPSNVIAKTLLKADELSVNTPENDDFFIIVPVYTKIGSTAYGISAGAGELHFTIRSWNKELLDEKSDLLHTEVKKLCEENGLTYTIEKLEAFDSNINNEEAVSILKKAISTSNLEDIELSNPNKWGEDFGYFTHQIKGCMFGLGSGLNTPALHNPDYDFPDEIIEPGVKIFYHIIKQLNGISETDQ